MNTWLITGCSTGLGRHLAQAVLAQGWNAVITARDPMTIRGIAESHPDTALALSLDVTDPEQMAHVLREAERKFGGVDVLVNNAGYGYRAAVEEGDPAEVDALFATNFFGPVALIKVVLPGMRARHRGAIVNVSSIAGRLALPGSGYYSASKFALEGMSDALRKEVAPLGIKVLVVEPGAFRTHFAGRSLQQSRTAIADYAGTAGQRRKEKDTTDGRQPGDPARGAMAILRAVETAEPPFRLLLGRDAIQVIRTELDGQRAELDAWQETSLSTDFQT